MQIQLTQFEKDLVVPHGNQFRINEEFFPSQDAAYSALMNIKRQKVYAIALTFSALLKSYLKPEQMAEVIKTNSERQIAAAIEASEDYACATHDFLDANVVMEEAFIEYWGDELDIHDPIAVNHWSTSWDVAVSNNFFIEIEPKSGTPFFPNGFESFHEAHYDIVRYCIENEDNLDSLAGRHHAEKGMGGMYGLAESLTMKFEYENIGVVWGEDKEYFDTIEAFLETEEKYQSLVN